MFVSVLVRRLKPGMTYEDFVRAWYPDKGFGFAGRGPVLARNIEDDREIVAIGFMDLQRDELPATMERIAAQESVRHDRIAEVIESTALRGIYEIADEFDFSTDETVARGRPATER
jgi:hypothetical protein